MSCEPIHYWYETPQVILIEEYISIDSAHPQRDYFNEMELWMFKRMKHYYPWKSLLKSAVEGATITESGLFFHLYVIYILSPGKVLLLNFMYSIGDGENFGVNSSIHFILLKER
ncbi:hypothetical protein BCR32DRAFT_294303 [Anaeromyces robustus]|uniref:Uncharacterized protein n=1 Tax=Anaeromyces robustus TaxID=1754192 RepID=A0A1Y1X1K2_9FUNG|nr:hypothetical protein BCR32DRAFT_294303 [Anaeromyces robustus]|eukprot:ORX79691.1 hypothetical protein BCR32DRAFT_294303 [Anaeromyces robustus]